jgi:hypothetical protein
MFIMFYCERNIFGLPHARAGKRKKCDCVAGRLFDTVPQRSSNANRHRAVPVLSIGGRRPPAKEGALIIKEKENEKKPNSAIPIAASLIVALRLHREEINPSPSLTAKISDSIRLAEMIQARLRH